MTRPVHHPIKLPDLVSYPTRFSYWTKDAFTLTHPPCTRLAERLAGMSHVSTAPDDKPAFLPTAWVFPRESAPDVLLHARQCLGHVSLGPLGKHPDVHPSPEIRDIRINVLRSWTSKGPELLLGNRLIATRLDPRVPRAAMSGPFVSFLNGSPAATEGPKGQPSVTLHAGTILDVLSFTGPLNSDDLPANAPFSISNPDDAENVALLDKLRCNAMQRMQHDLQALPDILPESRPTMLFPDLPRRGPDVCRPFLHRQIVRPHGITLRAMTSPPLHTLIHRLRLRGAFWNSSQRLWFLHRRHARDAAWVLRLHGMCNPDQIPVPLSLVFHHDALLPLGPIGPQLLLARSSINQTTALHPHVELPCAHVAPLRHGRSRPVLPVAAGQAIHILCPSPEHLISVLDASRARPDLSVDPYTPDPDALEASIDQSVEFLQRNIERARETTHAIRPTTRQPASLQAAP